jgi:Na+-transporting NADH:ubiquinone oxidoreductase subunit NqrD
MRGSSLATALRVLVLVLGIVGHVLGYGFSLVRCTRPNSIRIDIKDWTIIARMITATLTTRRLTIE